MRLSQAGIATLDSATSVMTARPTIIRWHEAEFADNAQQCCYAKLLPEAKIFSGIDRKVNPRDYSPRSSRINSKPLTIVFPRELLSPNFNSF